jgi:hypothetical protein
MIFRSRFAPAAAALALLGIGFAAGPAAADWRYRPDPGAVVAAGALGLMAGAIAGSALAAPPPPPAYHRLPPPPVRYAPARGYPVYEDEPVTCWWQRRRVQLDPWTYQVRRVRVCE